MFYSFGDSRRFRHNGKNYAKAVEILKDRFGRKDAIINSHMQKLLSVTPLKRSNDVKVLRQFFDMCQTQIRSLESLGVAFESFSALLCPLILNCLPYDLVLEFDKETDGSEYKLDQLLKFLNKEISARERAESSFSAHISPHQNKISPERSSLPKNLYRDSSRVKFDTRKHSLNKNPSTRLPTTDTSSFATAANFIATSGEGEGNELCLFCGQPSHPTSRCVLAREKSLNERKNILMKKGACFSNNSAKENNEKIVTDEDTTLSNSSRSKEVLLQTLVVCIKGKRSDTFVRVILDTGSQKSYISKFIAEKLQLKCMGGETTVHGPFGGIERSEKHEKYVATLSDVFNSYSCEIEVMDQERICTPIPKLNDSELLNELKEHGIFVSDASMSESYCLFEREPNEIHILLGADVIGNLLKGEEVKPLRGGLVAVNTHLGWTVMGKLKVEKEKHSNVLLSLYVSDNCIKDLWSLDVIGIKEPCEKKTRIELEEAARDHFARNVSRDEEGRHVIGLREDDKPFLRFLWWENGDKENTKIYQHKRVVFGISSSPFLLGATLEHHLKQVTEHLEVTAQKLLESFYVDNCVTSVDNEEELRRFMIESREILSPAKFNLRGWEHTGVSAGGKSSILEEEKKVPVLGDLSLHVFCDASKTAYASCVFLRTEIDGTITCQLVQARARVAPIKAITIPRLELLACTIGSRLVNTTKSDLGLEDVPICCWSDSVNVLYWIKGKENWGTFVYNRVQEIRRLTNPEDWRHIAGILNPADLPSRGCDAEELTESLRWEGPNWLKKPREEWPLSEVCPDFAIINSERKRAVASTINSELKELNYLSEISSYEKIIRVTAWIFRFYNNIRKQQNDRDFGDLNTQETDAAERAVLKIVQKQSFPNNAKSLISQMQTLVDSNGVIRIKSQLTMRKDSESLRYPIVLPSKHPIVTKLILGKHLELCHAGVQTVMSTLQEKYWILKSRKTVRSGWVNASSVKDSLFDLSRHLLHLCLKI
ncbi:hypothetical protein AVEN_81534-1, partial [Araneus ventricosus]